MSGFTKSKKSSAARMFSEIFSAEIIEMSDPFRDDVEVECKLDDLLETMHNYRKSNGGSSLAKIALEKVCSSDKKIFIITGVRSALDYSCLVSSNNKVYTIYVHSPALVRHNRLDRDKTSIAKGKQDYSTVDSLSYKEGIRRIVQESDYTIINDPCYPLTLLEQIKIVANSLSKNCSISISSNIKGDLMNERGVTVTKLPVYDKNHEGEKDIISRIVKPKGELATISIDAMNYLAYVDFPLDGKPRANHYHEEKVEYLYLIKGKVKLFVRRGGHPEDEVEEYIVEEGSLINMHPGFAHAYVTIEAGFAVEFSPTEYNIIERDKVRDYVVE